MRDWRKSLGILAVVGLVIVGLWRHRRTDRDAADVDSRFALQLQWAPQAQFAGYFAADGEGYYAAEGLKVEPLRGGPDVIPQVVGSDPNGPEFTISWVPKVLEVRANGSVGPGQHRPDLPALGTRSVSWAAGKGPSPNEQ